MLLIPDPAGEQPKRNHQSDLISPRKKNARRKKNNPAPKFQITYSHPSSGPRTAYASASTSPAIPLLCLVSCIRTTSAFLLFFLLQLLGHLWLFCI
ncbi:hypothetical protein GQ54DRAFT_127136 [Martensiomyces pterosporus]|nr:hypothetical protein GQ54DRAFT_127136 [Martensiomyces pterosporus]